MTHSALCVVHRQVGEDRFLNSLAVSADGGVCVCGDDADKPSPLLVWDLRMRKLRHDLRIRDHEFLTRMTALTDDGRVVVCVARVSAHYRLKTVLC